MQVGRQAQRAVEGDGARLRESDAHPHDFFSDGRAPFLCVFGRYIFFRLVKGSAFFFFFRFVRQQDRVKRLLERRRAEHRGERRVDARHGGGEGASGGFAGDRRVRFAERSELFGERRRRQRRTPPERVRHRGRSRLLLERAHRRRAQPRVGGGAARRGRGDRRKRFGGVDVGGVDVDEPFKPRRRRVAFCFVSVRRRRNGRPRDAFQFLDERAVVQLCRFVHVARRVAPGAVRRGGRFRRPGRGRKQRPEQRLGLGRVRREQPGALRRLQVPQDREALSSGGGRVCGQQALRRERGVQHGGASHARAHAESRQDFQDARVVEGRRREAFVRGSREQSRQLGHARIVQRVGRRAFPRRGSHEGGPRDARRHIAVVARQRAERAQRLEHRVVQRARRQRVQPREHASLEKRRGRDASHAEARL